MKKITISDLDGFTDICECEKMLGAVMKKLISIFLIIYVNLFAIFAQDSLAIDKDCAELKKYMQEASIDCSMAIDEGLLDVDDVIQKIKVEYDSVKNKDKRDKKNSKGIYSKIFAESISNVFSKELPYKNSHMLIYTKDFKYKPLKHFVFHSKIYFEKKGNEFYVEESDVRAIKKGMKYTGDNQNLLKVIHKGRELYRFGIFSEYMEKKAKISINDKSIKVPVKYVSSFVSNEEISYKITDKSIVVSITTCRPKDLEKFRKRVSEIRKEIDSTDKTVIIDLRNNTGGFVDNIHMILYSLLFEQNGENLEYFSKMINKQGSKIIELNTQIVRDRVSVDGDKEKVVRLRKFEDKYLNWEKVISEEDRNVEFIVKNPKYNKELYILTNASTASAAEDFILFAKKIYNKVIIVGDNTLGCLTFSGPRSYLLPDSKVSLFLSPSDNRQTIAMICGKNWKGETYGVYPDYWATSEEIVDTIVYLSKDEELRKVILTGKQ